MNILPAPQEKCAPDGSIASRQVAEVILPRSELERMWTPEYMERLARTYWRFLTRVSLGVLRVLYTPRSREVVVFRRPFVLLRFHTPEYQFDGESGTVAWPIDRGLLVARGGRGLGYLRLTVRRAPDPDGAGPLAAVTVSSEVVSFYPTIAARLSRWFYNQTQLRIHVIVTHAFLRSLANLEFEESRVGFFSRKHPARPGARGTA